MHSDFIPLSAPHLAGHEWSYVKECLDTGWVSSIGGYVDRFERELAACVGAAGGVACSSGTAALHVALILVGVRPDDEVVVPTLTFIASANAVAYLRAKLVFVDAELPHYQLDPEKLTSFLTEGCLWDGRALRNRATGRRIAAIMPVHVLGHPCDMGAVLEVANRFNLPVIEDATESLGSRYKGRQTGTLGTLGCFSFNGNKLITTGSGGMIVGRDLDLLARARYLTTQAKDDAIEFVHNEIGFNYRLSNVSAAIGVAQLEQLNVHVRCKLRIADAYDEALGELMGITPQRIASWAQSNRWLYTVRVDAACFGCSSRELLRILRAQGIETRPLWQPMHRSPAHEGSFAWRCEAADVLNAECLSLPCSVGLSETDQQRVIDAIRRAR